jgi:hypothetical protein
MQGEIIARFQYRRFWRFDDLKRIVERPDSLVSIVVSAVIAFSPALFWPSQALARGDDGALYFLFPREILKASLGVEPFSAISTEPIVTRFHMFPLALVNSALGTFLSPAEIQKVVFGASNATAYLMMLSFLSLLLVRQSPRVLVTRHTCSLVYVFAPIYLQSFGTHLLLPSLSLAVPPLFAKAFFRLVQGRVDEFRKLIIVTSIAFSFAFEAIPYLLPVLIASSPVLVAAAIRFRRQHYISFSKTFLWVLVYGAYWIIPTIYSIFSGLVAASNTVNDRPKDLIFNTFSELVRSGRDQIFKYISLFPSWTSMPSNVLNQRISQNLLQITSAVGALVVCCSVASFGFIFIWKSKKQRTLAISIGVAFLISIIQLHPGLVPIGYQAMSALLHLPIYGLAMKNYFDKAPLAFVFFSSIVIYIGICSIDKRIFRFLVPAMFVFFGLVASTPSLVGAQFGSRFEGKNIRYGLNAPNDDYLSAIRYLREETPSTSRILELPMQAGGWAYIQDNRERNLWFEGTSPTTLLTNRRAFNGIEPTPSFGVLTRTLDEILRESPTDWDRFAAYVNSMGITHVLINWGIPLDISGFGRVDASELRLLPRVSQANRKDLESISNSSHNFGSRYSLYELALPKKTKIVILEGSKVQTDRAVLSREVSFYELDRGKVHAIWFSAGDPIRINVQYPISNKWRLTINGSSQDIVRDEDSLQRIEQVWNFYPKSPGRFVLTLEYEGSNIRHVLLFSQALSVGAALFYLFSTFCRWRRQVVQSETR